MDTGNCLLIDSLIYIYRKYSFREKVKYVISFKKERFKITVYFFWTKTKEYSFWWWQIMNNILFNPARFYPGSHKSLL